MGRRKGERGTEAEDTKAREEYSAREPLTEAKPYPGQQPLLSRMRCMQCIGTVQLCSM